MRNRKEEWRERQLNFSNPLLEVQALEFRKGIHTLETRFNNLTDCTTVYAEHLQHLISTYVELLSVVEQSQEQSNYVGKNL